ncbi:MAG TPA: S8 family serine peptidase [Terriglobia bacterium]|nr:S8 family serine peptidase [Terriglobia bacterium]
MTGRSLKIAVIDTGLNAKHPHICAPTHRVMFDSQETEQSWEDVLGHGTAVTAAIQEKAPQAEYYILKLFGNSLRTTAGRLIHAIEWTIEHRMDVVNLSLGSPNLDHRPVLESLVARATASGVMLVAARYSGQTPVLPGMLDGVISVDVDWDLPRDRYRVSHVSGSPCFFASGFPRPLPGVPVTRNLSGISFAVANMTGFVARACENLERRSLDSVLQILTAPVHSAAERRQSVAPGLSPG